MIKKSFIIVFCMALAVNASSFLGDDEKDKKVRKGGSQELSDSDKDADSTGKEDRPKEADDTLVFEDWDHPTGSGQDEAPNIIAGASSSTGTGDQSNNAAGTIASAFKDYNEQKYKVNFTLYPNPAITTLNIAFENTPQMVRIYSITGTLMYEGSGEESLDVSSYTPGTYIVQLVYFDHVETAKFVKGS